MFNHGNELYVPMCLYGCLIVLKMMFRRFSPVHEASAPVYPKTHPHIILPTWSAQGFSGNPTRVVVK